MNDITELRRGFEISLRALNRAPGTIKSYLQALDLFRDFSVMAGYPTAVDMIKREQVEAFVADQLGRWKPKTAAIRYGALLVFCKWCVKEGEITNSPMAGMGPPSLPEVSVPVVSDDDLKKLLKVCSGTSFVDRRDTAILRLFIDCGPATQRGGHAGHRGRPLAAINGERGGEGRTPQDRPLPRPRRHRPSTAMSVSARPTRTPHHPCCGSAAAAP